jgi:hypothetical protein
MALGADVEDAAVWGPPLVAVLARLSAMPNKDRATIRRCGDERQWDDSDNHCIVLSILFLI